MAYKGIFASKILAVPLLVLFCNIQLGLAIAPGISTHVLSNNNVMDALFEAEITHDDVMRQVVQDIKSNVLQVPQKILVFGCGSGAIVKMLLDQYPDAHVLLTDKEKSVVDFALTKIKSTLKGVAVSAAVFDCDYEEAYGKLAVEHGCFDIVLSHGLVRYVRDPKIII